MYPIYFMKAKQASIMYIFIFFFTTSNNKFLNSFNKLMLI